MERISNAVEHRGILQRRGAHGRNSAFTGMAVYLLCSAQSCVAPKHYVEIGFYDF